MTARARAVTCVVLLLVIGVAGLRGTATPAWAHAQLVHTDPGDGETVAEPPEEVIVGFDEPVTGELGAIRVFERSGEQVDAGDAGPGAEPSELRVSLPEPEDGTYVVAWRAISADGHPVRGAFLFSVGAGGVGADDDLIAELLAGQDDVGFQLAATVTRGVAYAGLLVAVGALGFALLVHDRRPQERPSLARLVVVAAAVGGVATLASIPLQGAVASGLGASALWSPQVLGSVLGSGFGQALLWRAAGAAAVGAAAAVLWRPSSRVLGITGALAVATSFALTGHTAVTEPRWLAATANVSHTLFAGVWLGGLAGLLVVLRRRRADDDAAGAGRLLAGFSTWALGAVAVVAVAGSALAWSEVRAIRALFSTTYGWTLVAKVVVVALVIGAAAYNRRVLVPRLTTSNGSAGSGWRRLRRVVRAEVAGLAVVLVITALLVNVTPARTAAGITGVYTADVELGEEHLVNLTIDPNRAGINELHLYLFTDTGQVTDAERATLSFTHAASDIGPIEREADRIGQGHWTLRGEELSVPGRWEVTVTTLFEDLTQAAATATVDVGG